MLRGCNNPTCDREFAPVSGTRKKFCSETCRNHMRNSGRAYTLRIEIPMSAYHQLVQLADDENMSIDDWAYWAVFDAMAMATQ